MIFLLNVRITDIEGCFGVFKTDSQYEMKNDCKFWKTPCTYTHSIGRHPVHTYTVLDTFQQSVQ